jgi:hypothetical protein
MSLLYAPGMGVENGRRAAVESRRRAAKNIRLLLDSLQVCTFAANHSTEVDAPEAPRRILKWQLVGLYTDTPPFPCIF